jgi:hypothetical protein
MSEITLFETQGTLHRHDTTALEVQAVVGVAAGGQEIWQPAHTLPSYFIPKQSTENTTYSLPISPDRFLEFYERFYGAGMPTEKVDCHSSLSFLMGWDETFDYTRQNQAMDVVLHPELTKDNLRDRTPYRLFRLTQHTVEIKHSLLSLRDGRNLSVLGKCGMLATTENRSLLSAYNAHAAFEAVSPAIASSFKDGCVPASYHGKI